MIKVLFFLFHVRIILPGLGYHHHYGKGERDPVHHEKFQGIIHHGRIGTGLVDNGESLPRVMLKLFAVEGLFPRYHPVIVSTDRIYLSIVGYKPVRMSPLPGRRGIR